MTKGLRVGVSEVVAAVVLVVCLAFAAAIYGSRTADAHHVYDTHWGICGVHFGNSGWWFPHFDPLTQGNLNYTACVSIANNRWHAVRPYNLNTWPGMNNAVTKELGDQNSQLGLTIYRTTTDNLPDVKAYDAYYGNNVAGAWVDCPADNTQIGTINGIVGTAFCRGQKMRFNASFYGVWGTEHIACHEIGHTYGLNHRGPNDITCMNGSLTPSLDGVDVAHVDSFYQSHGYY